MFHRVAYHAFVCLFCLSLPLLNGCGRQAGAGAGSLRPPATEVVVDAVAIDDVQIYVYADGLTVPANSVDIRARVSGFLEELFFEPGAIVREGDRLALIEQTSYQIALSAAQAELASSRAQADLASANLERGKLLYDRGAIPAEDLQTYQANHDMAIARIESANANIRNAELNLQYTDIRSPITGKTTKNLVDIGNYVNPSGVNAVLLSITQLDPMFVEFKLNDRQFLDLKERIGFRDAFQEATHTTEPPGNGGTGLPLALTGLPVDVSLQTGANVFSFDFNIPGKIVALIDDRINFSTAQITIRAEIQNPLLTTEQAEDYMIYPGQVCRVRLPYEEVNDAILVREEAILTDLDTKYVLIVDRGMYQDVDRRGQPLLDASGNPVPPRETDIVHRRNITIGRLLDNQMRIVLTGLAPGESYIVHGLQRVRSGTEVAPLALHDYNIRRAAESEADR
ncbi:MAG: efflux RND transporter periplasmic adaptor subunit [Planctomycetaceae bacterium]|nr:efflux RND transporter periplasmic adaptor subunit [Planctomycetaceae bacterium]